MDLGSRISTIKYKNSYALLTFKRVFLIGRKLWLTYLSSVSVRPFALFGLLQIRLQFMDKTSKEHFTPLKPLHMTNPI
jgi:hypothetical protein